MTKSRISAGNFELLNRIKPKSEFTKNILTLMTGASIAQAIPIAISPILTRIYTPEDFGLFALYMSIASLIAVMATGRYELAIMLPRKEGDAANIVALSIGISLIVSFLSLIVVHFLNAPITHLLGNPEIGCWLYFIPVTVMLTGVYQSFNYWSNRKKHYKRLAYSRIAQSSTTAASSLGMGFAGLGTGGLIASQVAGHGIAAFILARRIWMEDNQVVNQIRHLKIVSLLKKHKNFPLFNIPNVLVDNIRLSGINILIAKFFTTAVLGQFSLAWKMVQIPMSLISSSLSQVFFQKISTTPPHELHMLIKKFLAKGTLIALPIYIVIYFFAPIVFTFVFGSEWKTAGEAAAVMAPWLFLNFLTSPLSTVFIIKNRQHISLLFATVYMILPLSLLYFLHDSDFIHVLQIITLAMCLMLVIFILLIFILIRHKNQEN